MGSARAGLGSKFQVSSCGRFETNDLVDGTMISRCYLVLLSWTMPLLPGKGAAEAIKLPDTVLGERLQAFYDATVKGTKEGVADLYRGHFVPTDLDIKTRVENSWHLYKMWGKLTPKLILCSRGNTLTVLAESTGKDRWQRCEVLAEDKEPFRLRGVAVFPAARPELCIQHYPNWKLKKVIGRLAKEANAPALGIAIIRGDEIESAVTGVRKLGEETPVKADDRFHLGSVTKSITATVIGKLVEDGKMRWDQSLQELLPDFEIRPEYRKITIEQVLQHRAGLPRYKSVDVGRVADKGTAMEQRAVYVAKIVQHEPVNEPGTKYEYSNAGYGLAGHIAERVAGKRWEDLVRDFIFKPLRMTSSGFGWPANPGRKDQPWGHFQEDGKFRLQELKEFFPFGPSPAGNVHCSIDDLARYARLHLQGLRGKDGALKAATIKRLHTPLVGTRGYASGWWVTRLGTPTQHMHGGSGGSFLAQIIIEPESNVAVAFVANARPIELEALSRTIVDAVRSEKGR